MVYVHVPFCRSFCTYCGFYSEVCRGTAGMEAYVRDVCREAALRADEIRATRETDTLYIGGGTPSVLPLSALGRIVGAVASAAGPGFGTSPDRPGSPEKEAFFGWAECTVEVNPEDIVEKGETFARGLRALGVNRISMGVQSFDDGILRWMNRRHTADRAAEAFRILRAAGFDNISIDLIFGLPRLSESGWEETLEKALSLAPEHLSAYQLSVEEGSALAAQIEAGRWTEASEETCRRQYDRLCRRLAEAGYRHYEVSNFARPGFEARHNSAYWRRVPYVGLGPGAHSFRRLAAEKRTWNSETPAGWTVSEERLSAEDVRVETLMLGLRTDRGLPADHLRTLSAPGAADRLLAEGALVEFDAGPEADTPPGENPDAARKERRIRIPEDHFFVSDDIIRDLI